MWLHVGETGLKLLRREGSQNSAFKPVLCSFSRDYLEIKTEANLRVDMNVFTKYDDIPLGPCIYIHHKTTGAIRGKNVEV